MRLLISPPKEDPPRAETMIKLVVFDWNGVLIEDVVATVAVDKQVFKAFGHKPINLKRYQEIFTMPVKDFFIAAGFTKAEMDKNAVRIQEMFHKLYESRIAKIRTRTGAKKLLAFLEERGIDAVILSNHTKESITSHLKRLGIEKYFSRVIANDIHATMQTKNKAQKLVEVVRTSSHKKGEMLIIGDSVEEIEAARASGIRAVSITGGYYSERRLREAKPDHVIHNLQDLIPIIKAL